MDDGYRKGNGIVLCTNNFTLLEVQLLVNVLKEHFALDATINIRNQKGKHIFSFLDDLQYIYKW